MEPNIFRMLFSIKNKKIMMLKASCTFVLKYPKPESFFAVPT
jgi:hypothetical protein